MNVAPILLFTYKRVTSLKATITALQENYLAQVSELYIFSDGARSKEDEANVDQVREFIKTVTGFKKVIIHEAENNKGLANSIIDGTSTIMKFSDKVIVMEDDLLTTRNFLDFMNEGLNRYEADKTVFSISGYSFNLGHDTSDLLTDAYFLNRGWSWGWATWADRWNRVDWEVKDYQEFCKKPEQRKAFAAGGSDLNGMLAKQMNSNLDSWAIRWFYNQFKLQGLTLYPKYSKVYNNGFDGFATHTNGSSKRYIPMMDTKHARQFVFPAVLKVHPVYLKAFQNKMGIVSRIKSKIETLFIQYFK
jgi:hypothetical protein